MKLKKLTKLTLLENGYTDGDILTIEDKSKNIKCLLCDDRDIEKETKISHKDAVALIGEYNFATAICRALTHNSAVRQIDNSEEFIYFERKELYYE